MLVAGMSKDEGVATAIALIALIALRGLVTMTDEVATATGGDQSSSPWPNWSPSRPGLRSCGSFTPGALHVVLAAS